MAGVVQTTYATPLFEVALEKGVLDEVAAELSRLRAIFRDNSDYVRALSAPVISRDTKLALLDEAFSKSVSFCTLNFLKLLCENGRFSEVISIIDEFQSIFDAHNGILVVTATTAMPMSDETAQKLQKKLSDDSGKKIRLETVISPSVLGGIKLSYNNTEVDATVSTRLEKIKQDIKQITL